MRFLAWLKANKAKISFFFVSVFFWTLVIFPFGDLSDLIGSKVSELTQNQLFVQFSNLQVSLWPLGIRLNNVSLDTPMIGPIDAKELTVAPSLSSLFSGVPMGSVLANGIFRGDIEVSMKSGTKTESGLERKKFEIHASHLNLQELHDVANLPVSLKGQISIDATAQSDMALAEQPEAEVLIHADKFELPSQAINTAMGPINVPDLKLSTVEFKGHMSAGKIVIEEGRFGKDTDEIRGTLKGDMMLSLRYQNGVQPQMGAYDFDVDLTVKSSLEDRLSLFLVALSQFKSSAGDSSRFRFHVNGTNPYSPPSMSALK